MKLTDQRKTLMKIYLEDWYSVKEASERYTILTNKTPGKSKNHRTVFTNQKIFLKQKWLIEKRVEKQKIRKSYLDRCKLTGKPFIDLIAEKASSKNERFMLKVVKSFFENECIQEYLSKSEDIFESAKNLLFFFYMNAPKVEQIPFKNQKKPTKNNIKEIENFVTLLLNSYEEKEKVSAVIDIYKTNIQPHFKNFKETFGNCFPFVIGLEQIATFWNKDESVGFEKLFKNNKSKR